MIWLPASQAMMTPPPPGPSLTAISGEKLSVIGPVELVPGRRAPPGGPSSSPFHCPS